MAMRLLTPSQAQAESRNERVRIASRDREAADLLAMKHKQLAEAEADFQQTLASQRARWALEEKEHSDDIERRHREIAILEEKKRDALMPIEELRRQLESSLEASLKVRAEYERKQHECDQLEEVLTTRIDDAQTVKDEAQNLSEMLRRRSEGIELQEEQTRTGARFLSEEIERFRVMKAKFESDCSLREISLQGEEQKIRSQQFALEVRENSLLERERQVEILEIMNSSPINQSPVKHG